MARELTGAERDRAREIWELLTRGDSEAFEAAPEPIRAAIFEASKAALETGEEPEGNPFE